MTFDPRSKSPRHDHRSAPPSSQSYFPRRSRRSVATASCVLLLIYWCFWRPPSKPLHKPSLLYKSVDWSRYAYSQYATSSPYLCNSVMVFETLDRLGSKADRILLYPREWDVDIANTSDRDSQLLVKARDWYKVKLIPVDVLEAEDRKEKSQTTWSSSLTKLLTFNQTQYDRILHFDSDSTLLAHMDSLFLLPSSPLALPRAYWTLPTQQTLTSLFLLLEPSTLAFETLLAAAHTPNQNPYDMDILNTIYWDSAMVLPHRQYGLITGEFRAADHDNFLGNDYEVWDPEKVLREASLVHFSDWPLPKPWVMWPWNLVGEMMPKCKTSASGEGAAEEGQRGGKTDCRDRDIWKGLYDDFRKRRKDICALLSAPAPEWPPREVKGNATVPTSE